MVQKAPLVIESKKRVKIEITWSRIGSKKGSLFVASSSSDELIMLFDVLRELHDDVF